MPETHYDAIVIGSGAGGSAVAYQLVRNGKTVLLLEKGDRLPRDGSTLDVKQVFKEGKFKNKKTWVDNRNRVFVPDEFYNVGGKTKWYGAALLRFGRDEFQADEAHQCLAWPIDYDVLAPYYDQAERLLHVNTFDNELELQALIDKITNADPAWRAEPLPLGLKREILNDPAEAKHFDGFASACGYKSDAEWNLLYPIENEPNFQLLRNKEVSSLSHTTESPSQINGVHCTDGSHYTADTVILAAGAMSSPRILQDYLEQTGLNDRLLSAPMVGAFFKFHINSALVAFSPFENQDVLRKTTIFFNDAFPHSNVQCLGWIDGDILATQLPAAVPKFVAKAAGKRAYGFFVTTEDGSSEDNRILSCGGHGGIPVMDYELDRIPASIQEHRASVRAFEARLLKTGLLGVSKYTGIAGTAHALGSLVMGNDPRRSVVDPSGKVHDMEGLYVADGSVLPRSSRVNPALTIYAWGLRLGDHLK
ncbi:MAG: GMC family oxidoreductase [Candidatus Competibacteraceae bacterium]|jgi:choline dehydrogenase-like flavoprotein|nr:GMC family oxidoreductase [Candidatus Competibacteraceae bacterium]